jgi:hypothetical protein
MIDDKQQSTCEISKLTGLQSGDIKMCTEKVLNRQKKGGTGTEEPKNERNIYLRILFLHFFQAIDHLNIYLIRSIRFSLFVMAVDPKIF